MAKSMDTASAEATRSMINKLNGELQEALASSLRSVNSLAGNWTGPAADAAVGAFSSFAGSSMERYKALLDRYADFLGNSVSAGYTRTEQDNASKADQI